MAFTIPPGNLCAIFDATLISILSSGPSFEDRDVDNNYNTLVHTRISNYCQLDDRIYRFQQSLHSLK